MNIQIRVENDYIFLSNKSKCKAILTKNEKTREDIIDFLISLHLVLETGLNRFYREIILMQLQKTIAPTKIAENLDKINFIDKTVLFFYMPHFDFHGKINEADNYHSAIGMLKDFAQVRNRLLHGHMDGHVTSPTGRIQSSVSDMINEEFMHSQIEKFIFIVKSVKFYFYHLDSTFSQEGKESIGNEYLTSDFLERI